MTARRLIAVVCTLAALWAMPGCLLGTAVFSAELVIPFDALGSARGEPECLVGVNLESNLSSYVQSTYPKEEWKDQYRTRMLSQLSELEPGREYVGSVGYIASPGSIQLERSTGHPISLVDTCASTTGAYRCTLPTSHGLTDTVACPLYPFLDRELSAEDGPQQVEITYSVEACRVGSCKGGWSILVREIRPIVLE